MNGLIYQLTGSWRNDSSYGNQFFVTAWIETICAEENIMKALECIDGISPKLVRKMYEVWGKKAFHVLDSSPKDLPPLLEMNEAKYWIILESYKNMAIACKLYCELAPYGVSRNQCKEVAGIYRSRTFEVVRQNPQNSF